MNNKFEMQTMQLPTADMTLPDHYVVTVGRSFGSGGRQIGKLIADKLGIDYYDKELLLEAARHSGMSSDYFERNDERTPSFLSGTLPFGLGMNSMAWMDGAGMPGENSTYRAQCEFIRHLASQKPCVIIGRSADYVLRDFPNAVNIFVHAPIEYCIDRIVARMDSKDRAGARALAEKTNKVRAAYYNFYTDKRWGDASSYHLTFDSSVLSLDDIAQMVIDYIYRRFGKHKNN